MSELKAFRIKEVEDGCPFWQAEYEVYAKSEADKLIAELNMRICEGDEDFEIANNQIKRLMKIVRHQKYKRCLAMSEQCKESMRLMRTYESTDDYWWPELGHDAEYFLNKGDFYKKWRKRWLELAEKFRRRNADKADNRNRVEPDDRASATI